MFGLSLSDLTYQISSGPQFPSTEYHHPSAGCRTLEADRHVAGPLPPRQGAPLSHSPQTGRLAGREPAWLLFVSDRCLDLSVCTDFHTVRKIAQFKFENYKIFETSLPMLLPSPSCSLLFVQGPLPRWVPRPSPLKCLCSSLVEKSHCFGAIILCMNFIVVCCMFLFLCDRAILTKREKKFWN